MCELGGCQAGPLDVLGKEASVWSGRGAGGEGVMEAAELDSTLGGSLYTTIDCHPKAGTLPVLQRSCPRACGPREKGMLAGLKRVKHRLTPSRVAFVKKGSSSVSQDVEKLEALC